jgi:hypothetical protein
LLGGVVAARQHHAVERLQTSFGSSPMIDDPSHAASAEALTVVYRPSRWRPASSAIDAVTILVMLSRLARKGVLGVEQFPDLVEYGVCRRDAGSARASRSGQASRGRWLRRHSGRVMRTTGATGRQRGAGGRRCRRRAAAPRARVGCGVEVPLSARYACRGHRVGAGGDLVGGTGRGRACRDTVGAPGGRQWRRRAAPASERAAPLLPGNPAPDDTCDRQAGPHPV